MGDHPVTEIEIGRAKRARRAYSFDDVAIVPSRRTRDPEEVSVDWQIDAYRFELPVLAAPMDSVMSPAPAIALGRFGGLGVLNLEGLWTRYEDPTADAGGGLRARGEQATARLQEMYAEPVKEELITERVARSGTPASPSPARCRRSAPASSRRPWSTPGSTCS